MISVKQWRKGKQVELAVNLQSAMFNVEGVSPVLFFDEFLLKGSWLPTSPRAPVTLDQIPSNNSLKYTPDLGRPRLFSIALPCTLSSLLAAAGLNMFQQLFPLLTIRDFSHADPGRPGVSTMRGLARPGCTARSRRGF